MPGRKKSVPSDDPKTSSVTVKRKNGEILDPKDFVVVHKRKRNFSGKPLEESTKRNVRRQKVYKERLEKYGASVEDIVQKNVTDIATRIRKSAEDEQKKVDDQVNNFTLPPIVLRIEDSTKRALTDKLFKLHAKLKVGTLARALQESGAMLNPGAKNQPTEDAQYNNALQAIENILRFKSYYQDVQNGGSYKKNSRATREDIERRQDIDRHSFDFLFKYDGDQRLQVANPECLKLLKARDGGPSASVVSGWVNGIATIIGRLSGFKAIYPAYSSINKAVKDEQLSDKNVLTEKETPQWRTWSSIIDCTQKELEGQNKVLSDLDFLFWALNVLQPPRRVLDWTALKYNDSLSIAELSNRRNPFNFVHFKDGKMTLVINKFKTQYLGVWLTNVPQSSLLYDAFKRCIDGRRLKNNALIFKKNKKEPKYQNVEGDDTDGDDGNVKGGLSNSDYNTKLRLIFLKLEDSLNGVTTADEDIKTRIQTFPSQRIFRHMFINFIYLQQYDTVNRRISEEQKKWLAFQMGHEQATQQTYLRDFDLNKHPEFEEKYQNGKVHDKDRREIGEFYLYNTEWKEPTDASNRSVSFLYEWLGFPPSTTELGIPSTTDIRSEFVKYDTEFSPEMRETPRSGDGAGAVFMTLDDALKKFKAPQLEEDIDEHITTEEPETPDEPPAADNKAGKKRKRDQKVKISPKKKKTTILPERKSTRIPKKK